MTEYRVYCINSKHYRDTFLPHAFNKELSESFSGIDDEYAMYTWNKFHLQRNYGNSNSPWKTT